MYDSELQRAWGESSERARVKRRLIREGLPAALVVVAAVVLRATLFRSGPRAIQGLVTLVIFASVAVNFWTLQRNRRDMRAWRESHGARR